VTVDRLPDSAAGRPLAAGIGATQGAVGQVQAVDEPEVGYRAIARLSGHLAAMSRTVYPHADGHVGTDGQLRAVCLDRAREVEWALRLLQCQLSGCVSAVGRPPAAALIMLTQRLDSYRSAEQVLVTWLEDQLPAEGREGWRRSTGARSPTRPPGRTRGAPAPGRCGTSRSGCMAAGTGCSTRWTHGPASATASPCPRRTAAPRTARRLRPGDHT
jgi:hypothetical protein